eukprot:scaffold20356_cov125-Isochrysis_galbana.AAC.1
MRDAACHCASVVVSVFVPLRGLSLAQAWRRCCQRAALPAPAAGALSIAATVPRLHGRQREKPCVVFSRGACPPM